MKIKLCNYLKATCVFGLITFGFFAKHLTADEPKSSGEPGKPNIIVFFLDDSGYGDYAHNGNPTIRTPNISKLAQDGMNFTQFYVTSPACSASRYSLLTGRYPGRSGLGLWVIGPGAKQHLHPKEITLAEGLKIRGYQTGIFGKWHLGDEEAHQPHKRGGKSRRGLLGDVMEEIDYSVGRIRQVIKEAGLRENTLIIFSSDNGPWITFQDTESHKKYGEARLHVGYAQPFRDGKGSTWEGGHRVPGIFCWPGKIAPHSVVQDPVSTLDILPTVFALAGADLPKDRTIDGRDIRPYLMPQAHESNLPEFEFYYSWQDNMPSALRVGPWKIHTRIASQTGNNYGFRASRDTPLLFQVEQDLGERIDRAGEQSKRVDEMMKTLTSFESQIRQEGSFWNTQ